MSLSVFESRQMVEEKSFRVWKFNKHPKVDITGTIDQAFFNGKDVCEVLGYVNAKKALQEHLGEDEKKNISEWDLFQEPTFTKERRLYF